MTDFSISAQHPPVPTLEYRDDLGDLIKRETLYLNSLPLPSKGDIVAIAPTHRSGEPLTVTCTQFFKVNSIAHFREGPITEQKIVVELKHLTPGEMNLLMQALQKMEMESDRNA
ncbi:MAG TPA: hypothetical protein V6C63_21425 [Allocoleopsis sp.]